MLKSYVSSPLHPVQPCHERLVTTIGIIGLWTSGFAHLSCASWKNLKEKRLFSGCHECCWVQIVCHSHHHNLFSRDSPRTWDLYIISTYFKQQYSWKCRKKKMEEIEFWKEWTVDSVDHKPAYSTYSSNTQGTAEMRFLHLEYCSCCPDVPLRFPYLPRLPRSTSEISFATSFAWHCTSDLRISCRPKSINIKYLEAPREIRLKETQRTKNSCKKSTLAIRDLCTNPPHTMLEDTNCLHFSWYVTIWYLWSGHIMSWYVCKNLEINKSAPWVKMDYTPNSTLSLHPRDTRGLRNRWEVGGL